MNTETAIFRDFDTLLTRIGFVYYQPSGNHRYYRHEGSDTVIILPEYAPDDRVSPHHLIGIRRLLDEKDLLAAADFDRALAGSSPDRARA